MLNKTLIMGRFVDDPVLRYTPSNTALTSFTIAVGQDGKNSDGSERQADFIDCVAWRSTAEFICRNFKRGKLAVIAGRLTTRVWKDRHEQSRKTTELVAGDIYFAGGKDEEKHADMYAGAAAEYESLAPMADDETDFPF